MPKIRHIAIVAMDPDKLAKFYCEVFEMKEMHRSPSGNVHLSDGYFHLAILRNKADGKANGLNHFGFQVEDTKAVLERLKTYDVVTPTETRLDRPYVETRATDPEGNTFDLAGPEHDFAAVEASAARRAKRA
jgi:catechol 2,3-dioxygenase-like lactoylglutathione lyase family enzyme